MEAPRILNTEVVMVDEKKPDKTAEPVTYTVKHPKVSKPIVAADGHVVLSQEDIDARSN
jgi:hypothetical protein